MRSATKQRTLAGWHVAAIVIVCAVASAALAGDGWFSHAGPSPAFWRFHPVGGWHPDPGGVWHWWNPYCYPHTCGPDDYCRKPPPNVCRPVYPPFYMGAHPNGCPDCAGLR